MKGFPYQSITNDRLFLKNVSPQDYFLIDFHESALMVTYNNHLCNCLFFIKNYEKYIIKANPNVETAKSSKALNSRTTTMKSEQIVLEFQVRVLFTGRDLMP